ncbi:Os10g0170501 [Oryza sativa Japonica Group]|uniref:Os10g0170501 protein n=1 Tax=Oryza sativa subsp. japonica TaxID=39947 RepID=A0A0P0XT69_ORYSJ|nr:Os10g0170501 [Oryza sativa Japonica Group]
MYYKYIHCIQKELDSSLKPVPSNPLSLPWNSSPPLLASLPTTILLGKICYKTLKDYGLCCETPEDRVFARGHYKKVVISCWTLIPLFYYFRSKWREKSCVSTKIPLYSVLPLTSFLFPIFFFAVEQRATATGPSRDGSATAGRRRRRIAHGAAGDALRVGAMRGGGGGLDFFASRSHAARLVDLITSPWPTRVVTSKHTAPSSHAPR